MEKRGVIILLLITAMLVGSCTQYLPVTLTICGDLQCGYDEEETCPSDCTEIVDEDACLDAGGNLCEEGEMCAGYYMQDGWCCSEECVAEITEIQLTTGKNFLSLPYVELNDNVEDIIPSDVLANVESIYYYDCEEGWIPYHTGETPSDPDFMLTAGFGYVFFMAADDVLYLSEVKDNLDAVIAAEGVERTMENVDVCEGWNYIASSHGEEEDVAKSLTNYLWAIEGTYGSLWHIDVDGSLEEMDLSYNYNLLPTYAYWIYVTEDGVIIP